MSSFRNTIKNSQCLPTVFQQAALRSLSSPSNISSDGANSGDGAKRVQYQGEDDASGERLPYGSAPNITVKTCAVRPDLPSPVISTLDRKAHAEARTVSFLAEHTLPLSLAPHLIDYAKEMAKDATILNSLSMSRTSATYKLVDGLGYVTHKRIVQKMRTLPFSINVDECTSQSYQKVFSIMCSVYCEEMQESVVYHYASVTLTKVSAVILQGVVVDLFDKDNIPFSNLVACLCDSANMMRGSSGGFETLLRKENAPHLLDIDGDICHHVHNICKNFCGEFERVVESLQDDIHTDFKYSTDLRQYLQEICNILKCPYHRPKERISHRWLSVYDCLEPNNKMLLALKVLYYSWVDTDLRSAYKSIISDILKDVSGKDLKRIAEISKLCKDKNQNMTKAGKERKKRLVTKLFYEEDTTMLYVDLYMSVLPLFKSFILIFEQSTPMVHKLHDELVDTARCLLGCFIKPEHIKGKSARKLEKLNVEDPALQLPVKQMFTGDKAAQILARMDRKSASYKDTIGMSVPGFEVAECPAEKFRKILKIASIATGKYLLHKFPLSNPLLMKLSALDPIAQGHSSTGAALRGLMEYFPTRLEESEREEYVKEVSKLQLDDQLPSCEAKGKDGEVVPVRIDHWWKQIFPKYPVFAKIVKACLCIISSPVVERNFSIMNDVINKKTNRIDCDTFNAIQSIKYDLQAKKASTIDVYKWEDKLRSPVDKATCYHVQTAYSRYQRRLQEKNPSRVGSRSGKPAVKKSVHQVAESLKKRMLQKRKVVTNASKKGSKKAKTQ
jgi:hypothetical protein